MAEDIAELEMRPAEAKTGEKPDLAPMRENDDKPGPQDGLSNDRVEQEIDQLLAPRPRWPLAALAALVGLRLREGRLL